MTAGYLIDKSQDATGYNLTGLATITASGFNTTNLTRLYNRRQSSACQANDYSCYVDLDLGEAKAIDVVGILGHNLTAAASVVVYADTEDTFTSAPVAETLTYNESQIIKVFSSDKTYRYWRILIIDTTNSAYPHIGELVLGKLETFTYPPTWGLTETTFNRNISHETDYGALWNYYLTTGRAYSVDFQQRPDTEAEEIVSMVKNSKGSYYPVLLILDTDEPNDGIFGHLMNDIGRQFVYLDWNDLNGITITEQPRAKVILTMQV